MTTVTNLATGDTQEFYLPPQEAVNAAYRQSRRGFNTWDYDKHLHNVKKTKSGLHYYCGDFIAPIPTTKEVPK